MTFTTFLVRRGRGARIALNALLRTVCIGKCGRDDSVQRGQDSQTFKRLTSIADTAFAGPRFPSHSTAFIPFRHFWVRIVIWLLLRVGRDRSRRKTARSRLRVSMLLGLTSRERVLRVRHSRTASLNAMQLLKASVLSFRIALCCESLSSVGDSRSRKSIN